MIPFLFEDAARLGGNGARVTPASTPPRGRIPAEDLPERERALLETARSMFYDRGYERTTVESIARLAHVSPKTIYARYGGKDGMFLAAMTSASLALIAPLESDVPDTAALERALTAFGTGLLDKTLAPGAVRFQRLMFGSGRRFPKLVRAFYDAGPGRGLAALGALLERAVAAGVISCQRPHDAAQFFLGALQGDMLRRALLFDETPPPDAIRQRAQDVARTFVRAYRPDPRDERPGIEPPENSPPPRRSRPRSA